MVDAGSGVSTDIGSAEIENMLERFVRWIDQACPMQQFHDFFDKNALVLGDGENMPVSAENYYSNNAENVKLNKFSLKSSRWLNNPKISVAGMEAAVRFDIFAQFIISKECPSLFPDIPNQNADYGVFIGKSYLSILGKCDDKIKFLRQEITYQWSALLSPSQSDRDDVAVEKLCFDNLWDRNF